MNCKTTIYRFSGDTHEIKKYTSNPGAYGALFVSTDTGKVYIMNKAQEIIEVVSNNWKQHAYVAQQYTNCKNCGAPLTSHKCEYCGTEYY